MFFSLRTYAEDSLAYKVNVGFGFGLNYGGFGGQLSYNPIKQLGIFGALGYNLNAVGYNLGASANLPVKDRIFIHLTGMYGYNAVLIVKGYTEQTKTTYYGPSVGPGLSWRVIRGGNSFLRVDVFIPFRPDELQDAIDVLNMAGYDTQEPFPVTFSVGYCINIK